MRPSRSILTAATLLAGLTVFAAAPTHAQGGFLQRAKQRAKEKLEQEIDKKTADTPPPSSAPTAASSGGSTPAAPAVSRAGDEAPSVNANYDFTPGTRVLFADDFAKDNLGDFPRRLELVEGNLEVAEIGGKRYLRQGNTGGGAKFEIRLPETLPETFTVEMDLRLPTGNLAHIYFDDPKLYYSNDEAKRTTRLSLVTHGFTVESNGRQSRASTQHSLEGKVFPFKIMADGRYVKMYADGQRVGNVPNANLGRSRTIRIELPWAQDKVGLLVGNVRVAAGGKDLYSALESEGRVTAEGILFDTNSDRLRPESDAVLAQIGEMLTTHAELRLSIEGHTDNVGQAAANQTLSQKRAAAVKAYLVAKHGVDAARLEAKGFGSGKPVAPNADEAGRQKNRRVELVKL